MPKSKWASSPWYVSTRSLALGAIWSTYRLFRVLRRIVIVLAIIEKVRFSRARAGRDVHAVRGRLPRRLQLGQALRRRSTMQNLPGVIGLLVILAIPGLWGIWYVLRHPEPEDECGASPEEKPESVSGA